MNPHHWIWGWPFEAQSAKQGESRRFAEIHGDIPGRPSISELNRSSQQLLPFQIHSGDIEHNSFQPEDHKETLREGTVANAFSINSSLEGRDANS